jgi:hypothetical protein
VASAHSRRAFLSGLALRRLPAERPAAPRAVVPAPSPARGMLDAKQVHARARELGLDVAPLLSRSLRLTPAPEGVATRTWVGGTPDLPDGFAWPGNPLDGGLPLPFAAQVERPSSLLLFFADPATGAAHVARVARTASGGGWNGAPMQLSVEWSLPPRYELTTLRTWLAHEQGVQLHDEAPDMPVPHRLYGWPDDDRDDGGLRDGERLLLQLVDPAPGVARLTFWSPRADLAAGDLSRVRARITPDPEHTTP